jgi:HAD superfamily hydrolase (TIGR01509 family)
MEPADRPAKREAPFDGAQGGAEALEGPRSAIQAIVFDFDGVLADSEPLHLRAYQDVLQPLGLELTRDEYYANYLGYDDAGVFTQIAQAHGLTASDDQIAALIEEKTRLFDGMIAAGEMLYPAAVACVHRMSARYPLGIASGALRHEIEAILRAGRLDRHFRFIVASGETREGKPAPDPYRRAAELHGVRPASCVAIEDSRWGIESAKGAGLWCIGITNTYPRDELTRADAVIDSLEELTPGLIEGLQS